MNNIVRHDNRKESVLFPPISIAPYLLIRNYNLLFIPYSYLIFIERINPSDPLDFDLFVNDVLLIFSKIKKLFKDEYEFLFLFDTELFYEELIFYIPTIVIPRNHPIPYNNIILSLDTKMSMSTCYVEDLFKILIPSPNNNVNIKNDSDTIMKINCETHDICNPLTCLSTHDATNKEFIFPNVEQLLGFLNDNSKLKKHMIIEIWSCISPIKLHRRINQSYYLWSPIPQRQYFEALTKFIMYMKTPYIETCYIISPKNGLSEYGSINSNRVWLSSILNPIIHRIEKIYVYIY
ncbi:hypothetical protein Igag_1470 [Ignisphaera aggregans DSM 17230]|uniref:Uncharacterized protein n=1 Tax=Ignisphaera aggregans (strain DSM 17230 / JCM 13409 / AQ1.S1) TaxID=583356 RepID=E0SQL6_IGNAA|nr:hypothetical protein Igag_1470 [Ignisphaera aggregans DSM 17230]